MCKYCEPYHEEQIDGENGDAYVTKYGELVVFPNTDFEIGAVHLKIKFCPMCGERLKGCGHFDEDNPPPTFERTTQAPFPY